MKHVILILFSSVTFQLFAQEAVQKEIIEFSLSSPYNTIYTHLEYLQDDSYYPTVSAKAFNPSDVSQEKAVELAIRLKQILDGKGLYLDMDDWPRNINHLDSVTGRYRYYLTSKLPDLYVEKVGNKWYYSKKTVNSIDKWHSEVFPYGTDRLLELFPHAGSRTYFGLYLWQHMGILALIFLSFLVHKLFTFIIEKIIIRVLMRFGYPTLAHEVVVPVARPLSILVIFPILMLLVPVLQLPVAMGRWVVIMLKIIWPVFAIVFFYRVVDILSLYFEKAAEKTKNTLDDQLVPLARKVLKTFVIIIGVLFILDNLEVNITGIIAGLSIGGIAFALAAQDTIKNFFGSLMIFIDKPFQVGDWISSGEVDGTVEEVGFRSTRVRTFRNSLMYVPNAVLTDRMVDNHGLREFRRFFTQIAVQYDTPPVVIEAFVEGLRGIVNDHPKTRKEVYHIYFNDLADSSLNIMFYVFFAVPTWAEELQVRHEILLSIIKLADELGVQFAFPTQTLHVETFPEKLGNSAKYVKNSPELKTKVEAFLVKNRKAT